METKHLYNYCKGCGRGMSPKYTGELCPLCIEAQLFDEVREFIRSNEVNEYDVAARFNIPVRQVKQWIKEGRIEYKEQSAKRIESMHCSRCGIKLNFGTLCQKCLKELNGEKKQGFMGLPNIEEGRMRFVEMEREKE